MTRQNRAGALLDRLPKIYPDARCALEFSSPLELLVATILSAQCTDRRVNLVTRALFLRCRNPEDYASIPQDELEGIIHSAGFFRSKSKSIRAMASELILKHSGRVPRTLAELTALPGVGRKTANVVLGNAFGLCEGVAVDTHVARLSQRLGLTKFSDPTRIERDLMKLFPMEHWAGLSHWLISHGRQRCAARRPDCAACQLRDICPSANPTWTANAQPQTP
ncbi:MAG: endonuclease III [Verrucomicrobiae bacterium]